MPGFRRSMRLTATAMLLLALITLLAGCGTSKPVNRLVIRGGPSLDALFVDIATAFQKQYPEIQVVTNFTCPPCVMLKRGEESRDFDVFAAIGDFELSHLRSAGIELLDETTIGHTGLVLATSKRAANRIQSIADLHAKNLSKLGVGDPENVGIGHYTRLALQKAGLWDELQGRLTYSQSGCELLKWLGLGRDIDAAIVFDVCLTDDNGSLYKVRQFPTDLIPPVPLLLVANKNAPHAEAARKFIEFAAGPEAVSILLRHNVAPEVK